MRALHQQRSQPLGGRNALRPAGLHSRSSGSESMDPIRRAENRDRHSRYYAMHPARKSQRPDLVDDDGRRYRIAEQGARGGLGRDLVSLDVKEGRMSSPPPRLS